MTKETEKKPKRVFLIDTMSHIFRAFFAPMGARQEPLRNSKGQVTQAVFVFTNMLRKLLNDEKPDYIAAVFDSPEKTFRHDNFAAYKANRAEMPEDLSSQMPYIIRVCEAFNITILREPGYEADDIIGTLAHKVAAKGMQAVIVSNDKDLCQLVRDPLIVCMRQNSQNIKRKVPVPPVEYCDEAWVENKFGVPPSKIIDLLGLMGDSIDNIPGAPGIGEKGALKLVLEFGSAEAAMQNADKVTHKTYRESLQNNQELIRQSLELATIHTTMPIELDLEKLKHGEPHRQLAYTLFRELEFSALTREFADSMPLFAGLDDAQPINNKRNYQIIQNRADLDKLIRRLWETEHWSFEADGSNSEEKSSNFDKKPPLGIAIATAAGVSHYVDLENFAEGKEAAIEPLRDILTNGFLEKVTFDFKGNLAVLQKIGIAPEAVTDDVCIAAYLIDPSRKNNLETLAQINLGVEPVYETPEDWTEHQYKTAERADFEFQLAPMLRKKIEEDGLEKLYTEVEMPLISLLYRIEMAGMKVDENALKGFSDFVSTELETLRGKIYAISGKEFNINSPKQVGEILQELNIETGRKTATGQISTSKDILNELAEKYDIARLIIDYRELDKLKATYSDALPKQIASDGRIHGKLNQTIAATGRLSCLPANTLVNTERGLVNIESLRVGEKIRTPFGLKRILAWENTGLKPVVALKFSNGIILRCSSEHKIRSLGKWVKAGKLAVGDVAYMSFNEGAFGKEVELSVERATAYRTSKTPRLPENWSVELAEFVGYTMADGHIVTSNYNGKPSKVVLAFGWEDQSLIKHFSKICSKLFGKIPTFRKTRTCLTLELSGVDIASALVQIGAGGKSGEIRVPKSLFRAPEKIVSAFLRGYFEGDGCVTLCSGIQARSVSLQMLEDVQHLLTIYGIPSNVRKGTDDSRGYAPRYTLAILGDRSKNVFLNRIGFISQRKTQLCVELLKRKSSKSTGELLTLPEEFNINTLKPLIYDFYRQSNGRVPFPVMTWASKCLTQKSHHVSLPRFEWVEKSFTNTIRHVSSEKNFVKEAVSAQLYEVKVKEIWRENAVQMFDIMVEEVNQYIAQGILVHNSTDPNLQNIPIRTELGQHIRRAFIPESGCKLISADYSQLELRLLAYVTRDERMLEAFKNGEDIHAQTAKLVFGAKDEKELKDKRRLAKIVNFAIAYAVEAYGLSQRVGISRAEAKKVIEDYYETYKGVKKFMDETPEIAREKGFVTSIFGRRRYFPSINDRNFSVRSRAEREAINMPLQGTASDIVKIAMLKTDEALRREKLETKMIMQVHDELLFEAPEAEVGKAVEIIKREMESAVQLDVPLIVEVGVGDNWMNTK